MNPYLFVCHGISDSGKDTVAKLLNKLIKCTNIKFTESWKRFFEQILYIPVNSLDDKEYRKKNVFNTLSGKEESYSYNQLMYNWYNNLENINPGKWMFVGYEYHRVLNLSGHKCFTDVRNNSEIEMINKLWQTHTNILLKITGRGTPQSTDNNIDIDDIIHDCVFYIDNSPIITLNNLENQIKVILNELVSYGDY